MIAVPTYSAVQIYLLNKHLLSIFYVSGSVEEIKKRKVITTLKNLQSNIKRNVSKGMLKICNRNYESIDKFKGRLSGGAEDSAAC